MSGYRYRATRLTGAPEIKARWPGEPWASVPAGRVEHHMGPRPSHLPGTEFKVAYDNSALYVIFRVEDRFVRAVAAAHQDAVCRDSCVEFFFSPGTDVAAGYFNLEMNCGGRMLFHFQKVPRRDQVPLPPERLGRIAIAHSMPATVDPEIAGPATWTVEYRLPLDVLAGYRGVERPAPGVEWRANFYKCGDATSHPHWLTWAPVDRPAPDFHVPSSFGVLEFGKASGI